MKINKTFFKTITTVVIFFALAFSPNIVEGQNNGNGNGNGNGNNGGGTNNNNGQNNSNSGFTQTNGNSTNNNGGGRNSGIPLDGGLGIILIVGAAAFGIKKLRDNKKQII